MKTLKLYFEGNDYCSDFFKKYVIHEETDFESCDFVISSDFEMGNANKIYIQNQINKYKTYNKKVIIFLISDCNNQFSLPENVLLFRTSMYKSLKCDNEFMLPYLWDYFVEEFKEITKTEKPIVGFCGNVKKNSGLRLSTIYKLKSDKNIVTNFKQIQGFSGGKPELIPDFKQNILNSHFTLSNRGKGNFSIRFYQVLSLGRIPVLIDTDIVFPFENEIKWDKLIIRSKTQTGLVNNINHFWKSKNNAELVQIQLECKKTFDAFLSFEGYGNKMLDFLIQQKSYPIVIKKRYFDFLKFPQAKYKIRRYFDFYLIKFTEKEMLTK